MAIKNIKSMENEWRGRIFMFSMFFMAKKEEKK